MNQASPTPVRSAVVTGATRGVGRAFAKALVADGWSLVVNGRSRADVLALADELGRSETRVRAVAGSVADERVVDELFAAAIEEFGQVDALINNAGVVRDRTTLKMTTEEFDEVVAVNLRGAWLCGQRAARVMSAAGGGSIVNVVSEVAYYAAVGQSNYMAAKAGLIALTSAWSLELARYGVRVNGISPAAVTDMTRVVLERSGEAARAAGRPSPTAEDMHIGRPDQIAPLVVYLAGDRSAAVTGQIFSFDGRHLGAWSFPYTASVAESPNWTSDSIADAFESGALMAQSRHRPKWMPS